MLKEAIILAGGLGTRLGGVIGDIPKSMVTVRDRPFLDYIITMLFQQGIKKVILALGFKSETILAFYRDTYRDGSVHCCVEETPLGTGGAIRQALGVTSKENDVLVINGDTYFDIDIQKMYLFHSRKSSCITIALKHVDDVSRYGAVETNEHGEIVGFREKSEKKGCSGYISAGVYVLAKSWFDSLGLQGKFSFEHDVLQKFYGKKGMHGFAGEGYFIDIGVPEDLERARNDFAQISLHSSAEHKGIR